MWAKIKPNFLLKIQQWQGVLFVAPLVSIVVILGNITGVFQFLEWASYDQFFRLRPSESVENQIVIVTVDEADINYLKDWPMKDRIMAQLLGNIQAQNPRAIGVDIYRDLPVEPGHQELIKVFQREPKIFGIELVGGIGVNPPPTLAELGQVGASDLIPDADGKIRRAFIVAKGEKKEQLGLGVQVALTYLEKENINLEILDQERNIYQLGKAIFKPLTGKEGEYLESNTGGYQIILNYRGTIKQFSTISMREVLNNQIPADLMKDKMIFLGVIAPSLKDSFLTPYNSNFLINEAQMPGIVIHANVASQIIRSALEGREMLYALPKKYNWLWFSFWSFFSSITCWLFLEKRLAKKYNLFFLKTVTVIIVSITLIVLISYFAFLNGTVIPLFSPFLASGLSAILITNYQNQWQLKQANKKLQLLNQELEDTNINLEKANEQLENYSQTLEEKVEERTAELKQTLEELKVTQGHLIQTEKMAALGQMVAGVAHEINNPTNFIYGNVNPAKDYLNDLLELINTYQEIYPDPDPTIEDLIEDIDLDYLKQDFFKILDSMKRGAERIKEIVESLKIFARLDESEIKQVDIHKGIDSTLMILNNRFYHDYGLEIKIVKEYGDLPPIECYAGQLNQVFLNLLTNAIDAIEEKYHQQIKANPEPQKQKYHPFLITITTKIKDENHILISIMDNGLGIPDSVKEKIFDPFFTTKAVGKGSGLGLSTTYSIIVEQHQGKIYCESTLNQGTEFTLELPLKLRKSRDSKE